LNLVVTREPGGTILGTKIRELLLAEDESHPLPEAELWLYLADRAQHLAGVIRPAREAGGWILCDRFWDATVAYQGYGRGISLDHLEILKSWVLKGLEPDLTFLLDLPVEEGLKRARLRDLKRGGGYQETRFENEDLKFHQRIRSGYLALADRFPMRIKTIDASRPPETLHQQIQQHLKLREFPNS
jgi:dTMP kinase